MVYGLRFIYRKYKKLSWRFAILSLRWDGTSVHNWPHPPMDAYVCERRTDHDTRFSPVTRFLRICLKRFSQKLKQDQPNHEPSKSRASTFEQRWAFEKSPTNMSKELHVKLNSNSLVSLAQKGISIWSMTPRDVYAICFLFALMWLLFSKLRQNRTKA